MKKDQLVNLIRGIVKEEVVGINEVVPTLLAEVVAEQMIEPQQQSKKPIVSENSQPSLAEMIGMPSTPKNEVKYTDNNS